MTRSIPRLDRARRALGLAAAFVALAISLPAEAAQRTPAPSKAPATSPAPASGTATAPAATRPVAPVPLPPPPAGTTLPERSDSSIAIGVGAWAGFDVGKGLAVHVDYGFLRTPPTWRKLQLELRLAAMFAHPTESTDLSTTAIVYGYPVAVNAGVEKTSVYVFEVAPTARVRWQAGEKLAVFLDAGAGIAQTVEKYDRDEMFIGHTVKKQNVTGLVLRAGAGVTLALSERLRLLLVPVALSVQIGPKYSAFEPTLGVAYAL